MKKYYGFILCLILTACGTGRNAVSRGTVNKGNTEQPSQGTYSDSKQTISNNRTKYNLSDALVSEAHTWLGTKYKYGGHSKSGTDCSGMIMEIFYKILNIKLPRTSWEQQAYCSIIPRNAMAPGDLIFFANGSGSQVSHVGIFIGNNQMIHASPSRGVIISNIFENYFTKNFHSSGHVDALGISSITKEDKHKESKTKDFLPAKVTSVNLENLENVLDQKTDSILSIGMD